MLNDSDRHILKVQARILGLIVRNTPLRTVLSELCLCIEDLLPRAVAGVTVLDRSSRTFELAVFPSLQPTFADAMPGLRVADRPGSCAVAVYFGETVTSDDIAEDDRFQNVWRALNLEHGIRSIQSRPVYSPDGTSLGTFVLGFREPMLATDVDEEIAALGEELAGHALSRHRAVQRSELLLGELQHRTKNLFASIGALVYSTLRTSPDPAEFRRVFDGRLTALAHAHSLALQDSGADLSSLIRGVLAPYYDGRRMEISGPPLTLAPDAAAAFGLATHELATNAVKYGALSSKDGMLAVTWNVQRDAQGERMLRMRWAERGGPPVSPPVKSGFGRRAIERSLAHSVDGTVTLEFASQGLVCNIEVPLTDRLIAAGP